MKLVDLWFIVIVLTITVCALAVLVGAVMSWLQGGIIYV